MERAANIISQFANHSRKGSGKHLYFRFSEQSGYENGKYQRFRCITPTFRLTPALEKHVAGLAREIRLAKSQTDSSH
jgi:hypothetical protein